LLRDDALLERIEAGWRSAGLDAKRVAMLEYTEKLTRTPQEMDRTDVVKLRDAGFSDRDILDIAEVVGYYAYVNRIADGLGVSVETWLEPE
jgi:uncharacterized peroxidase-related enzyme